MIGADVVGAFKERLDRRQDVDLVVTGHTMPGLCGYELTRALRETLPELPVILMSVGGEVMGAPLLEGAMSLGTLSVAASNRLADLSKREREVLGLIVAGHGNKTVARMLAISPRTVENHRARIMRKTGSRNIATLVHLTLAGR